MANPGFFNHYDDPDDEYWDDEPVVGEVSGARERPKTSYDSNHVDSAPAGGSVSSQSRANENPFSKSALVDVELTSDRLPTAIRFARSWKNSFAPHQYAPSIMEAFQYATFALMLKFSESGMNAPQVRPSLRRAAPRLLQTRSIDEFRNVYHHIFATEVHVINGPGLNYLGQPGLVVRATNAKLISIEIDHDWVRETDSQYLAQDIVECCNEARRRRVDLPSDSTIDRLCDRDVAKLIAHHESILEGVF